LRSAFELALAGAIVAACGSPGPGVNTGSVPFTDHGTTQQSRFDGGPRIVVTADAAATGLGELAPGASGRLFIAVFQGTQRTGGYSVRVESIERSADRLVVRATFSSPPPGSLNIQVITSPAHLVSIGPQSAIGARDAVLVDQSGAERARATVPQSPS
jgi:hypothetical protein